MQVNPLISIILVAFILALITYGIYKLVKLIKAKIEKYENVKVNMEDILNDTQKI